MANVKWVLGQVPRKSLGWQLVGLGVPLAERIHGPEGLLCGAAPLSSIARNLIIQANPDIAQ